MTPMDIVEVLTAAAPIAASVASLANNNKRAEVSVKEVPVNHTSINITITNNFYVNSEREALDTATKLQSQLVGGVLNGQRYII